MPARNCSRSPGVAAATTCSSIPAGQGRSLPPCASRPQCLQPSGPGPLRHAPKSVSQGQGKSLRTASGSASRARMSRASTAPGSLPLPPTLDSIEPGGSVALRPSSSAAAPPPPSTSSLPVAAFRTLALRPLAAPIARRGVLPGPLALPPLLSVERGGRRRNPKLHGGQRAELRLAGPSALRLAQARQRCHPAGRRRRRAAGLVALAPAPLVRPARHGVRSSRLHRGAHHHIRLLGHREILRDDRAHYGPQVEPRRVRARAPAHRRPLDPAEEFFEQADPARDGHGPARHAGPSRQLAKAQVRQRRIAHAAARRYVRHVHQFAQPRRAVAYVGRRVVPLRCPPPAFAQRVRERGRPGLRLVRRLACQQPDGRC
eukprot:3033314-Pleurochrysis_carterae.AAC.1